MNVASLLQGVSTVLWVIFVVLVILAVLRASRGQSIRVMQTALLVVVIAAVLLTSTSASLVFVQPEERGVVISAVASKGYREQVLQPGLNWIVPFFETVKLYPISKQSYTMSKSASEGQVKGDDSISARTLDGQEIFIDASVIYEIDPTQVIKVHIAWQNRYEDGLVRAQSRGIIRDAVSQYRVEEVVSTKRAEMATQVRQVLSQKLSDNGLTLVDFVLRNITFSPEYAASVEQKQISEQQAQQAKFIVDQRKQEAEQARQVAQGQADAVVINAKGLADARLIQAEAEAKALELLGTAIRSNPDLLSYQYITKLSPNVQVMLVPNNAPYLLPLPTMGPPASSASGVQPTPQPTQVPTAQPTPNP